MKPVVDECLGPFIGPAMGLNRQITFKQGLLVTGEISGNVTVRGILTVSETGKVRADISAMKVVVLGMVKGNITAQVGVEIGVTGRLTGNIYAPAICIRPGGIFNGRCDMGGKEGAQNEEIKRHHTAVSSKSAYLQPVAGSA
ncbi:MAG: polymer-forming cytoskeletal protein [Treponema sp.]|jgi:cytoskeletal protein CcmA (bactofilin family)|nr:polymer-forming cytoskeletal protein [Treponema sp.]